jgi:hypothetical protein
MRGILIGSHSPPPLVAFSGPSSSREERAVRERKEKGGTMTGEKNGVRVGARWWRSRGAWPEGIVAFSI